MAIYRGPGGAGDATVDATNATAYVTIKAQEATDAATSAAASAAEAAASAVIASDGLDGIAAYAEAAFGSAADALASATDAEDSAANAAISETNAAASAAAAAESETNAAISAANANEDAGNAAAQATAALNSANDAADSATAALNSENNAASSASDAAASAASAEGYLPSSSGNNGKYLRTNGTTNYWAEITDVAAATITNDGVLFGSTDEGIVQSTTTYNYNDTVYTETPQNSLRGDGPTGHIAETMAQAIIDNDIVIGDPVKITVLHVATNVVQEIYLGTVTSCSGSYNSGTSRWSYAIYVTNPSSWNSTGYYIASTGLYIYDIKTGPASFGDENTQLGYNAGSGLTTGLKNVIIGSRAAHSLGSGSNNIIIGQYAQPSAANVSNEITIGKSTHTKTRLFGALALGGSSVGTSGQVLTSAGSGTAPTWTTLSNGTVTSVAMSVPTGLTVSGSPITSSGTLALTYTSGYSIPTTASQANWDTSYSWGNHASAGYLTSATAASTYAPLTGTGVSGTWGISITGNAATVTNGLYSSSTYSNPTWLTSISGSIVSGNISGNAANVTGTVAVANGGTGATSLTANNVLLGNGTSALQVVAPGTSGNVLTSNGTTWVSSAPSGGGGGGATGGGTDKVFYENDQAVTSDYTITTSKNAGTFGPITINTGVTVTIPTGAVWTVV